MGSTSGKVFRILPSGPISTETRGVRVSSELQTPYSLEAVNSVSLNKSKGKSYFSLNFKFSTVGSALIPSMAIFFS